MSARPTRGPITAPAIQALDFLCELPELVVSVSMSELRSVGRALGVLDAPGVGVARFGDGVADAVPGCYC